MMKIEVNEREFIDRFKALHPDNFTYKGLRALFAWLAEMGITGEQVECDVIALCCDFTEYDSLDEFNQDYYTDKDDYKQSIDDLSDYTRIVIPVEGGGLIVQRF